MEIIQKNLLVWLEKSINLPEHDTDDEELASSITHALGFLLAIGSTVLLLFKGLEIENNVRLIGYMVFGFTMIVLYFSSSFYHYLPKSNLKRIMRVLDHFSVYLLISGTYTPIMLYIDQSWAYRTLIVVYITAALGMTFKLIFWKRIRIFHVIPYLLMGWMLIINAPEFLSNVPAAFAALVFFGGLAYTLGTVMFGLVKLKYNHAIWHLFVLAGSACFFIGIFCYI
ncbi:MAG: PAQR family membrane homeostasis protein TrhA [Spirochaetia bacterium]